MKAASDGSLLCIPLTSAGLSDALVKQAMLHGYHTPADFLELSLTGLMKLRWLTPAMMEELLNYLHDAGAYLSKDGAGKKTPEG